jgi:hypothetical protein
MANAASQMRGGDYSAILQNEPVFVDIVAKK